MGFTDMDKFCIYPIYSASLTRIERLMVKLRFGGIIYCVVCGRLARINISGDNLRETCLCSRCGSSNRQRQIAYVICGSLKISSLKALSATDNFVVYNTESSGALHNALSSIRNYYCSEYLGSDYKSGDVVGNIMHQDLMNLSFDNERFDLVISSDILEHVPDPYKAHQEIYRVLKKGGKHIFTVPFYQTEYFDEDRVVIDNDGKQRFVKEPIYHSDPLRPDGILVYKIFSLEMLLKLKTIGFTTKFYRLYKPLYGILGPNAIVFEAIKK